MVITTVDGKEVRKSTGKVVSVDPELVKEAIDRRMDLIEVVDNSMEPTLRAGVHVLVEPVRSVTNKEIYLVALEDGETAIREVRCDVNKSRATLIPHNLSDHDPLQMDLKELCVIGRARTLSPGH